MAHKEMFIAWMKDAYAMEISLIETMERRVDAAEGYPQIQERDREHLEETRRHADMMKSCIEAYDEDTSSVKSGMSKLTGMLQGMGTKGASDTLVKNSIADYASEHFEIASYRALIEAAREFGDQKTLEVCQEILKDEERMASFLEEHLPSVVHDTMRHEAMSHD